MTEQASLDELKARGEGRPAPVAVLYRQAFRAFGTAMLWHWRELETPTIAQALAGLRRRAALVPVARSH